MEPYNATVILTDRRRRRSWTISRRRGPHSMGRFRHTHVTRSVVTQTPAPRHPARLPSRPRVFLRREREHRELGFAGRFGADLPRTDNGSLLFLQHMLSKRHQPPEKGGAGGVEDFVAVTAVTGLGAQSGKLGVELGVPGGGLVGNGERGDKENREDRSTGRSAFRQIITLHALSFRTPSQITMGADICKMASSMANTITHCRRWSAPGWGW